MALMRSALGRPLDLVASESALAAALGVASKLLAQIVHDASPRDPLLLIAMMPVMAVLGALTIWIRARRALKIDPANLLRAEWYDLTDLVAQRRLEIGIRIAVGSTRQRVVRLILKETLVLVVLGSFLGFCTAIALRHALVDQIYGIGVLDPELILSVVALLGTVAFTASLIPACRAMRIDPIIVLNDQ